MSRFVAALVYRKRIGSMARKSILAYCAERANDDGSGIWASKVTISKEVECSKKTVIETFNDFVSEGILVPTGKRKVRNGFVHVYQINLGVVSALKDAISHEEITGVNLNPSPDVTPKGNVATPQEVTSGDPNRPRTVLEPSITPKPPQGADDLFSAENETAEDPEAVKAKNRLQNEIEQGFAEFWKKIWPKHFRKTGKADCLKVYTQACTGKHPKAEKISPQALNAATRAYIRSVSDPQYLKGPLPWLRQPGWEPFVQDGEKSYRWDDLTQSQRNQLQSGNCPRSMLENGEPNAVAAYWLAKMRRAS